MSRDKFTDYWEKIIHLHWEYVDSEDSPSKLEKCKVLEGTIIEFLCAVPHDRKFFLPETAHVFEKSITELQDFSAFSGIVGFQAICQYANNLFAKPWRSEYRTVKTYSGFYHHEIKANLYDSHRLFEAMGYRIASNNLFMLEGPVCPDQLSNVSRDAMVAYVEYQIMKQIYSGLLSINIAPTWLDIYKIRENEIGGISKAIKSYICYKQMEQQNQGALSLSSASYTVLPAHTSQCESCASQHTLSAQPQQQQHHASHYSNGCLVHSNLSYSNIAVDSHQPQPQQQHQYHHQNVQTLPHSRSLDYYNNEKHSMLPQRHSFEQQPHACSAAPQQQQQHIYQLPHAVDYESAYDCLGLSSSNASVSYAAVIAGTANGSNNNNFSAGNSNAYISPYNVSGDRYPLPTSISQELCAQYATPVSSAMAPKTMSSCRNAADHYATIPDNHHAGYAQQQSAQAAHHTYTNTICQPLPPPNPGGMHSTNNSFQNFRQRSFPPNHQLIDFDDKASLLTHDYHTHMHPNAAALAQHNSFDSNDAQRRATIRAGMNAAMQAPPTQSTFYTATHNDLVQYQAQMHNNAAMGLPPTVPTSQLPRAMAPNEIVYAQPTPRGHRGRPHMGYHNADSDKYSRAHLQSTLDNRKRYTELKERSQQNDAMIMHNIHAHRRMQQLHYPNDFSCESSTFEDYNNSSDMHDSGRESPTLSVKNKEGIGRSDDWQYVYDKLNLHSSKEPPVNDLNLGAMHLDNDRRNKSRNQIAKASAELETNLNMERTPTALSTKERKNSASKRPDKALLSKNQQSSLNAEVTADSAMAVKVSKSAPSVIVTSTKSVGAIKKLPKSSLKPVKSHKSYDKKDNNNDNFSKTLERNKMESNTAKSKAAAAAKARNTAKSEAPIDAADWTCRFCTLLNPPTTRICEVCAKTKDCTIEMAPKALTSTCV